MLYRKILLLVGIGAFGLLLSMSLYAEENEPVKGTSVKGEKRISPELQTKIEELIKELGDDDWKVREEAEKELVKLGEQAEITLEKALQSKDAEIRLRVNKALQQIRINKGIKNLPKKIGDQWYIIQGPNGKLGCFHFTTKHGEYKKQEVLILDDYITIRKEGKPWFDTKSAKLFCRKDKYLSPLYFTGGFERQDIEFQEEKMIISEGQKKTPEEKPQDFVFITALPRLAIIHSYQPQASFDFSLSKIDPGGGKGIWKASSKFIKKQKSTVKDKEIDVSEFGIFIEGNPSPLYSFYINEEHELVKIMAFGTIELLLTEEKTAKEGLQATDELIRRIEELISKDIKTEQEAASGIEKLLSEASQKQKRLIIEFLADRQVKWAWKIFVGLLHDKSLNPEIRESVLYALGRVGAKESTKDIIPLLKDDNARIRGTAARVLANLGARETIKDIIKLLEDKAEHVRRYAACALGDLRAPEAIEPLKRLIKQEKDSVVRRVFQRAIERIESNK